LRLWRQYRDGERIDRPWGWLRRVAGNLAKDHNKSMFRRNGTHPPEVMNGLRSEEPMPLERMEREEAFARLRAALAELPSRDREILTLRYGLGYSNQEVADLLDLNIHAVYMRACRARQRLAGSLTEPGVTSPA
jgi:RNA polymerase sigma-70 factor (ECF subfamily)